MARSTEEDEGTLTCALLRRQPRLDSLFFLLWPSPPPPRSSGDGGSPAPIDLPVKTAERRSLGGERRPLGMGRGVTEKTEPSLLSAGRRRSSV